MEEVREVEVLGFQERVVDRKSGEERDSQRMGVFVSVFGGLCGARADVN